MLCKVRIFMRGFLPPSWISFFRGGKPRGAALSCSLMWRTSKDWHGGQQGGGWGWHQGEGQGVGQGVGWRLRAGRCDGGDCHRGDHEVDGGHGDGAGQGGWHGGQLGGRQGIDQWCKYVGFHLFSSIYNTTNVTRHLPGQALESFERTQWRKIGKMLSVWLYMFWLKFFEDAYENTQWGKAKQMQRMWLCMLSGKRAEESFEKSNKRNRYDYAFSRAGNLRSCLKTPRRRKIK